MAGKKPTRTKEEMGAFFEAWDGFNEYASKQIEKEIKEAEKKEAKKKAKKKAKK